MFLEQLGKYKRLEILKDLKMAEDDNQKSIKVGLLDSTRDEPSSPTFSNGPPPSFTVTPVTGGQNNHTVSFDMISEFLMIR